MTFSTFPVCGKGRRHGANHEPWPNMGYWRNTSFHCSFYRQHDCIRDNGSCPLRYTSSATPVHLQIALQPHPWLIVEFDILLTIANTENIIDEDQSKYQCANVSLYSESQNWRLFLPEDRYLWRNVNRTNRYVFRWESGPHCCLYVTW